MYCNLNSLAVKTTRHTTLHTFYQVQVSFRVCITFTIPLVALCLEKPILGWKTKLDTRIAILFTHEYLFWIQEMRNKMKYWYFLNSASHKWKFSSLKPDTKTHPSLIWKALRLQIHHVVSVWHLSYTNVDVVLPTIGKGFTLKKTFCFCRFRIWSQVFLRPALVLCVYDSFSWINLRFLSYRPERRTVTLCYFLI